MAFFTLTTSPDQGLKGMEAAILYLGLRNTDEKGVYLLENGKRLKLHKNDDGSYSLEPCEP